MVPIFNAIATILELILNLVQILIFASVIVSWVGADPGNPIVAIIRQATEPIYRPIRKFTANIPGPLDWAPLIALLIVMFLLMGIVPNIRTLGHSL